MLLFLTPVLRAFEPRFCWKILPLLAKNSRGSPSRSTCFSFLFRLRRSFNLKILVIGEPMYRSSRLNGLVGDMERVARGKEISARRDGEKVNLSGAVFTFLVFLCLKNPIISGFGLLGFGWGALLRCCISF